MPEATQLKEKAAWKANRVYLNKDAQKVIILEPGQEYTAKMAQKQKTTIRKKSMTFPRPRRQAEVWSRTQNPCGSLWRLWWMQAPFPLSPVDDLELPLL